MNNDPKFIIFTGPMFGSKTTKMLSVIERYSYQGKKVAVFKPLMDDRYGKSFISTHSGARVPAKCISNGTQLTQYLDGCQKSYSIIAVDEAFMIDGIAEALLYMFRRGYTVIVSSLQLSASGNVFEEMKEMMPWATTIQICPAVCPITGRDAFYTHRKIQVEEEIVIGGAETYEPRCWEHHSFMNQLGEHNDNFGSQ